MSEIHSNVYTLYICKENNSFIPKNDVDNLDSRSCNKYCIKCPIYSGGSFYLGKSLVFNNGFLNKANTKVKLSYAAGRALCVLQRNMDNFVSNKEILRYVWGDSGRVNNNVNVTISELRMALSDTNFCILNRRKVGYMLTEIGF